MVVCNFFLKGTCKFGNNCRNEHPSNTNNRSGGGGTIVAHSSFGAGLNDRYHFTKGGAVQSTNSSTNDQNAILQLVRKELQDWDANKVWPLSCFAGQREQQCISGLDDHSPEELRIEAYNYKESNDFQTYVNGLSNLSTQVMNRRNQLKTMNNDQLWQEVTSTSTSSNVNPFSNQSANLFSTGFGGASAQQTNSGGGLFGGTSTASLFASSNPSGGLFSSNTSTTQNSGGLFSSNTVTTLNNPFASTTTTTGGLFSSNSSSSTGLFGSPAPSNVNPFLKAASSTPSGGLFGSSTSSSSGGLFGGSTTSAAPPGGLFGSSTPAAPSGGLFGSKPSVTPSGGGIFGNNTVNAPSSGLFGSTSSPFQTSTSSSTPSGGLFSSTSQQTQSTNANPFLAQVSTINKPTEPSSTQPVISSTTESHVFSIKVPQVTPADIEKFKAAKFILGQIPTCPPPIELC